MGVLDARGCQGHLYPISAADCLSSILDGVRARGGRGDADEETGPSPRRVLRTHIYDIPLEHVLRQGVPCCRALEPACIRCNHVLDQSVGAWKEARRSDVEQDPGGIVAERVLFDQIP